MISYGRCGAADAASIIASSGNVDKTISYRGMTIVTYGH